MSKLKFRQFIHGKSAYYKRSYLQEKQWQQFAAIGYSIAIRGYLNCWRAILIRADITDPVIIHSIDNLISVSQQAEKRARWQIKHLNIM